MAGVSVTKRFRCYYCDHATHGMADQVQHLCQIHSQLPLKYRSFELNSLIGKFGYQTKTFNIIPATLHGTIKVDEDTGNVYHDVEITSDDKSDEMEILEESVQDFQSDPQSPLEKKFKTSSPSPHLFKGNSVDPHDDKQKHVQYLQECVPVILEQMKEVGHYDTWLDFNKMVYEKQFPLDNLSFLLFMDVCKFLSLGNSSSMRYSQKIKQFWRVGYKLFHGKWLRFMGGPKHRGHLVLGQSEKGEFNPSDGDINFVVPHRAVVSSDSSPISPDDIQPGILTESLNQVAQNSKSHKSYKICV